MMGGCDAFDVGATKKITAVYKRRPKKSHEEEQEDPAPLPPQDRSSLPVLDRPSLPLDRSSSGTSGRTTTTGGGIFVFRDEGAKRREGQGRPGRKDKAGRKDSWLNRSLSFRGRRSSLMPTYRRPLSSLHNNVLGSPSQERVKKSLNHVATNGRRTWAGVPISFVKEQRTIFADIDAFELDAKEAFYGPSPKKPPQHLRESLDYAKSQMVNYNLFYGKSALSETELLSAALRTPFRAVGKAKPQKCYAPVVSIKENLPFRLSVDSLVNNDEDVPDKPVTRRSSRLSEDRRESSHHRDSSHRLSDSSWISYEHELQLAQIQASPDVYAWDQPMRGRCSRSSVDSARNTSIGEEDIPSPGREDNAILDFETATLLTRLENLRLSEEDLMRKKSICTPVREEEDDEEEEEIEGVFRKMSHCTPVLEEDEDESEEAELEEDDDAATIENDDGDQDTFLSVFDVLLHECRQSEILSLSEVFSEFCDLRDIKKLGEGTFGEAFKGSENVFKIVPMDGRFQVNGETQKTSGEMLSEVVLSNALNKLRGGPARDEPNICNTFVQTKATRVCQGCYDPDLLRAWEDWDAHHSSENDHPSIFPSHQLYLVYVLTDGGVDLESFALQNFNEARSLVLQIVLALAVAEEACEFEHRDLHWGNIVLARDKHEHVTFRFLGQEKRVKSYGLTVSLIDFTLSRLNTGNQVLFCNLAADPALFEGPKNDIQANTYRKMQAITEGQWEGRFPKTNTLWIHYVADILLTKKNFKSSPADKRSLRGFKKRVLEYDSAGAAVLDEFFNGLYVG